MACQPYTPHRNSHEEVQIHATAHEQQEIRSTVFRLPGQWCHYGHRPFEIEEFFDERL
jgi:hypothetical protein